MKANVQQLILSAEADDMEAILNAAMERYRQLFPDWDVFVTTLERHKDRNEQLDRIIAVLNKMKASTP